MLDCGWVKKLQINMLHMVLLHTVTMYDFHDSTDIFLVNPSFLQFCVPHKCTLNYIRSQKKPRWNPKSFCKIFPKNICKIIIKKILHSAVYNICHKHSNTANSRSFPGLYVINILIINILSLLRYKEFMLQNLPHFITYYIWKPKVVFV